MNDFLIELQAKLDEAKSKGNINSDIAKIQGQIDKLKIQADIDPNTISILVKQLETVLGQKISIPNININQSQLQKTGQQIGKTIAQGISNSENKIKHALNSYTDLRNFSELNKSISNFKIDSSDLKDYQKILNEVKNTYAEFGQVKITNQTFDNGILQNFKVNIEQVNGDLKETKSFIMSLTKDNSAYIFDGIIKGTEGIVQHLDKTKNAVNQTAESINKLKEESQLKDIRLSINDGGDISSQIKTIRDGFTKLGLSADEVQYKMNEVDIEVRQLQTLMSTDASHSAITTQFNNLKTVLAKTKNELKTTRSEYYLLVSEQRRLSMANTIEAWNQKNTAATKEVREQNDKYIASLRNLDVAMSKVEFGKIQIGYKNAENSMRAINRLGASLTNQFKQAVESFTQWGSVSSAIMGVVYETKEAISELKQVDTLLTEISKANDSLTKYQLEQIGNRSFDIASKYGKSAVDWLSGVQEASRAGYHDAEGIAELSVAVQGAGDTTDELANSYIIATDKAFKMNGSVKALTETLDGSNNITNNNAVNMTELAEAMSVVGSQAASSQMEVNETTAAVGTLIAVTQQGGSEMGNAFKGILMNLRQVTGEVEDGGNAIDEESLTKYEKACNELGVSLSTVKDGVVSLKEPMQILKELSAEYTKLDESDARRANLLSAVGGKYRANALNAILENYDLYEKMLQDYAEGTGSMAREAEKTAQSWEGSMNRLSNTWTDTVENIANSDAIIKIINSLNELLSIVNNVTDSIGSLGTIGLGAGIFAGFKNIGKRLQMQEFSFC